MAFYNNTTTTDRSGKYCFNFIKYLEEAVTQTGKQI